MRFRCRVQASEYLKRKNGKPSHTCFNVISMFATQIQVKKIVTDPTVKLINHILSLRNDLPELSQHIDQKISWFTPDTIVAVNIFTVSSCERVGTYS